MKSSGNRARFRFYGLDERAWFDLVEAGKIGAEHHPMAAQEKDLTFDQIGRGHRCLTR
jgi:hypothetical protein